ncbi:MAG: DUF2510 domain-containing protein [Actinobacteria bacterium]|jgi:hypothetical protein|nr:DUF2510 domain-containing protein [Actinomycetota bacterium]MCL6104235.1 DUF2510 domain-containing protein [Actinomycetota bacterium]
MALLNPWSLPNTLQGELAFIKNSVENSRLQLSYADKQLIVVGIAVILLMLLLLVALVIRNRRKMITAMPVQHTQDNLGAIKSKSRVASGKRVGRKRAVTAATVSTPMKAPLVLAELYPPNWYRDPHNPQALRWWDGTCWTEHVRELPHG